MGLKIEGLLILVVGVFDKKEMLKDLTELTV
jgi:hypothetical protein